MTFRNIILFLFIVTAFLSCHEKDGLTLVDRGVSNYKIILSENADSLTIHAASVFQEIMNKATGVRLEIFSDTSQPCDMEISIGANNRSVDFVSERSNLHEDGFVIETRHKKLFIIGGEDKGVLYGVYTFMEDYLNCRKYGGEEPIIPRWETVKIPPIHIRQEPAFNYRELHMPFAREDIEYRNWHKLDLKDGKNEWGLFVHTFDDFVPADKYFKTHPEYFSFLNVKRIPDGQLCLSNPHVFHLVVEGLKSRMQDKPEARYWSVSQNDTFKPCECDECRNDYKEYGGYSGALIHFVNQVAAEFPDKIISTLAYEYTRAAPTNIKPASNVNIMFCSIECNRSRPLVSDPSSASFRKDMKDWCKLTSNIFMWDYVVQFRNLVSPFPNFRVLQPNIQLFRDNGIQMMFQQGSGGLMSEFVELRSYVIAKLLWDPDLDLDAIIDDFVEGYYGNAGPYIRQYIDKMHNALDRSGGELGIYGYPYDGINTYLTPELLKEYEELFNQAEEKVKDNPKFLDRVKVVRLPLEFAILDISLRNVNDELSYFTKTDSTFIIREDMLARLDTFTMLAKKAGITRYWEHGNFPDDYRNTVEHYARSSMQPNLALNKPVQLLTESSTKYPVGGGLALTDGLKGVNDYHFNWLGFEGPDLVAIVDLQKAMEIHRLETDFLQEIKSWVFLPKRVEYFISDNGETFDSVAEVKNHIPESKDGTFVQTFRADFKPIQTRYVKIVASNMGTCPDWHPGATYPSWIFCDEVMVW